MLAVYIYAQQHRDSSDRELRGGTWFLAYTLPFSDVILVLSPKLHGIKKTAPCLLVSNLQICRASKAQHPLLLLLHQSAASLLKDNTTHSFSHGGNTGRPLYCPHLRQVTVMFHDKIKLCQKFSDLELGLISRQPVMMTAFLLVCVGN